MLVPQRRVTKESGSTVRQIGAELGDRCALRLDVALALVLDLECRRVHDNKGELDDFLSETEGMSRVQCTTAVLRKAWVVGHGFDLPACHGAPSFRGLPWRTCRSGVTAFVRWQQGQCPTSVSQAANR